MLKLKPENTWRKRLAELRNYRLKRTMFASLQINKSLKKEFYRKAIHLSSLWIPLVIYLAPQKWSVALFASLLLADIIIEYANYCRQPWARWLFAKFFARTLRNKETVRVRFQPTGSMYVLAAATMCACFFAKPVAVIALSVMLISDTAAALFGKACGTRKLYKDKTLEGTSAFFLTALLINMLGAFIYPFGISNVLACVLATLAEMFEDKIRVDDNLAVPLIIGIILECSRVCLAVF